MTVKDKFAKLVDVKSIVTITLTFVFCYLSIRKYVTPDQFLTIYSVVVSFFFGVKVGQDSGQDRSK